ncbi:DNA polymerase I [Limnothrix sp. FACHB-881]|uniref:DNA polymerase I n=1 Tax=Limnothrix sp. FACHB-881 TaxID=2692819 RepID=UPI001688E067|nr:DNA polymerase I [Limnothrix sp. FACHB-881]MBD2636655.1 DNA polymerase I [Limnothrix sp. FACHB-881]
MTDSAKTLLLVDGHSLAFRAFYAFVNGRDGGLRTSTGIPTSICYGFIKALLDTIALEKPQAIALAFDTRQPTFRHEADATYKDGRPETPVEFIEDIQHLETLLVALNLAIVKTPGFEADDAIGTMTQQGIAAGYRVKILSGDRDLFQLINDQQGISVLHLGGRDVKSSRYSEYRAAQVVEKWGVRPDQVVDFKALCGDKSDNIPGVKGIGEKTAAQLLQEHESLDGIYQALDSLKKSVRSKLEADREAAYHSQFLAQIKCDVPLDLALTDCELSGFDRAALTPLLEKLELNQFLKQIERLEARFGNGQLTLGAEQGTGNETSSAGRSPQLAGNSPASTLEAEDTWFFSAEETDLLKENPPLPAEFTPEIITTPDQLEALVAALLRCQNRDYPTAWDTETTDLDPRKAALVGIGVCYGNAEQFTVAYIPVGHSTGKQLDRSLVLQALKPILESENHPKVLQNAKFDRAILRSQGIQLAGVIFDPMLASYVLNPEASHNLTDLGLRYLGISATSYQDLVPKGQTIAAVSIAAVANYCGTDVYSAFHLVNILRSQLSSEQDLLPLFEQVELPLEPVLSAMEGRGIRIDTAYLAEFSKQLETDLLAIEQRAYAAAGETFNLGSPKQLSELLFGKLGLDPKKSRKTKTGYSTDAATLEKLKDDHPVVEAIVEHRTLAKLKSTYVDALPQLVSPQTDRVHTDFNQTVTATGRLSSSNPNLQNIPIRTAFSRQIRRAFLPKAGWLLAAADYSQIELRILAHLSQEPVLIEAYQTGRDVHALTAQLLLDRPDITPEERRLGKIINFGVIYGMGAQRFAREAGVSRMEAKEFIDRFNQRYPQVFEYLQQMQREAIALGYVHTLLGRRRYFQFMSPSLNQLRGSDPQAIDLDRLRVNGQNDAQLLRAAANAPIQGSSADIIKIAMIQLHQRLQSTQATLLLQVHDELIFEVPPEEWDFVRPIIQETMESAVTLSVPLAVEVHAGQNWMEAK